MAATLGPINLILLAGIPVVLAVLSTAKGGRFGYEGFGSRTQGGQGGRIVWVDPAIGDPPSDEHAGSRDDPCSLRKALSGGKRVVKFVRGGTITLHGDIRVTDSYITIDGESAPAPGVTITHTHEQHGGIDLRADGGDIHDIIIRHIRLAGLWNEHPRHKVGWRLLNVSAGGPGGYRAHDIVLDHLTMHGLQDKTTLWGAVENVTVSWCLFYESHMATLVSFYNRPYDYRRKGISFHHNCYIKSSQRNPQLRGWIRQFDYVNNIVYGWEQYGMRIKNQPGERSVDANVINNVFCPSDTRRDSALIYGWSPGRDYADLGPEENLPQGTVLKDSHMGKLYVAGNILPPENRDQYSTLAEPLEVPDWAHVTTWPAEQLGSKVLPDVGMKYRNEREQRLIDEVAEALEKLMTQRHAASE